MYDFKIFIISPKDRQKLYERIDKRVDIMIKDGLINEVKELVKKYKKFPTSFQSLGYKETLLYLDGKISKQELIDLIKKETRHYAKRQLTWFRRYEKDFDVTWIDTYDKNNIQKIMEKICE